MIRLERDIRDQYPPTRVISVGVFVGGPSPPEDTELWPGCIHRRQGTADPTPVPHGSKLYLFDAMEGL